ncbi:MAG: MerR family transcriptional regulator [Spirochaetota bacterium]
MARLSMGEAEALLGLPASTLRHWETVLPMLAPRKDAFGRRIYSEAELRLLFRVRYLSQRAGLGLRETEGTILGELGAPRAEARSALASIRGDFIGLWLANRDSMRRLATVLSSGRQGKMRSRVATERPRKEAEHGA